jgi:hypothetical protein
MNLTLGALIKDPSSNTLTFKININPNLTNLDQIDFSQIITTDLPLLNPRFVYNNGVLELTYDYDTNIHGMNGSFTLSPSIYGAFFAAPNTSI